MPYSSQKATLQQTTLTLLERHLQVTVINTVTQVSPISLLRREWHYKFRKEVIFALHLYVLGCY